MKSLSLFVLLLCALSSFGQSLQEEVQHPDIAAKLFRNPKYVRDKAQGSPYLQKMFAPAKVKNIVQNTNMRYNVYKDEFEFIAPNGDTLVMDKIEDFETVTFTGTNRKYLLTPYVNSRNKLAYGYLLNLYEKNGMALMLRENIDYYEEKKAKTTLERDMPARYSKGTDMYYLKNKAKIGEFPGGKKDLIKLFPDKKNEIETFLKDNKLDFSDRTDMMKVIDLVATF